MTSSASASELEKYSSSVTENGQRFDQKNITKANEFVQIPQFGITEISYIESWSGPLPSPETLKEYAELDDNAVKTIFDEFSKERNHQRSMDKLGIVARFPAFHNPCGHYPWRSDLFSDKWA